MNAKQARQHTKDMIEHHNKEHLLELVQEVFYAIQYEANIGKFVANLYHENDWGAFRNLIENIKYIKVMLKQLGYRVVSHKKYLEVRW